MSIHMCGYKFVICTNFSLLKCWHCSPAECREGKYTQSSDNDKYGDDKDVLFIDGKDNDDKEHVADEEGDDDDEKDHGEQNGDI